MKFICAVLHTFTDIICDVMDYAYPIPGSGWSDSVHQVFDDAAQAGTEAASAIRAHKSIEIVEEIFSRSEAVIDEILGFLKPSAALDGHGAAGEPRDENLPPSTHSRRGATKTEQT